VPQGDPGSSSSDGGSHTPFDHGAAAREDRPAVRAGRLAIRVIPLNGPYGPTCTDHDALAKKPR